MHNDSEQSLASKGYSQSVLYRHILDVRFLEAALQRRGAMRKAAMGR